MQEMTWLPGLWRSAYKCNSCGKRTRPPRRERFSFSIVNMI
jgi:hypothetical protein